VLGEQSQSERSNGVPAGIFHHFQCSAGRMGILVKLLILFGEWGVIAKTNLPRNRSALPREAVVSQSAVSGQVRGHRGGGIDPRFVRVADDPAEAAKLENRACATIKD
jgi:hypothetical protein